MAQEFRATISGRILDASGSAVPNAKVSATNAATSETSNATTDTSGNYTIPFLRPGQYKLTATASGFKTYNRENITIQVGQIAGIDVALEVGALTDSVNVTADSALLETQTASRSAVINQMQVSEMPLNSRNPFMLGSMMSGVTFRGAAIWQRPFDNGAIAEWSVNGGRQSNNEFLMDGAPNNAQMGGNNIAYVPIVDAVQEFSVQQNSYDAQYGKTGGGVFNVVLKSGGNQHHGTVYEFMRRKALDANTFQNKAVGIGRPAHKLDQYGFQMDGPIYIPGILKKNSPVRLFYSGAYEGYKEVWPQFLRNSFPANEMRTGDFSRLTTPAGQQVVIYDPMNPQTVAGDPVRTPFAGNIIPASRISPVARAVTGFMPAPNATTAGQRYAQQNVLNPDYAATDDFYNLSLKFDWTFGTKHRAYFRHASNDRTEDRCVNGVCGSPGTDGQQPFQRINDAYVADWTMTVSPTTVLNVRASSNRFVEKGFGRANENFDLTKLGISSALLGQIPGPVYFGRWNFAQNHGAGAAYSSLGRGQGINITNNYNLAGNVTKIARGHTMKMGADIRRIHFIQQNSGDILSFTGETRWTQRLFNQGEATSGDSFASFLLGGVGGASNFPVYPFFQQWYFAPYFQDDWKISRKVTLNLGLRWDFNQTPSEKYNRINRGFNPNSPLSYAGQIPAASLAEFPNLRNIKGGLEFAGVNGNPAVVGRNDMNNWQPRLGVAYQLTDKTVLRGGWGLYFMNPNNDTLQTTGFSTNTPLVNSLDDGRNLIPNLLNNPYPNGITRPVGSSIGANTFAGQNYNWYNPNMVVPYVHQFSFDIQRQLSTYSTLSVAYVGSRTIGANTERDFNNVTPEFRKSCNFGEGGDPLFCNAQVTNPFKGLPAFAGTGFSTANTISRFQANRLYPQYNGALQERGRNDSNIWYNSLQVNYNIRMGRSLTLMANYTLSKMIERWGFNDPVNNVQRQGIYFNDRPHFFKFNTVYELPFGKGKKFGGNMSGVANKLLGGWQFSTFSQVGSGEPNDLPGNVIQLRDPRTIGGDWNGTVGWKNHRNVGWNPCVLRQFNDGSIRPQQFSLDRGCGTDTSKYAWMMTADYAPRYTPARSGQIRKQPLINMDVSIAKTVQITERFRFQFRVEAFNVTNYYFYGRNDGFNTDPNNPLFGTVFPNQGNTQNGYPRQVQLGFKFYW